MWDLAWVAHPMYVDAFFKKGEFRADVYKPKPDGSFRRKVIPSFLLAPDPASGRSHVEVVPKVTDLEFHCLLLPSIYPETGRLYFVNGNEFHFVFVHEESKLDRNVKTITDLSTNRHLTLPVSIPSRTIFFSPPTTVIAMKGVKSIQSTGNIQIINLDLH